jgi:hypothetical protein
MGVLSVREIADGGNLICLAFAFLVHQSSWRRTARFASSTPERPNPPNGNSMKAQSANSTAKSPTRKAVAKCRPAARGKYFNQIPKGTNLAIIDPALHLPLVVLRQVGFAPASETP